MGGHSRLIARIFIFICVVVCVPQPSFAAAWLLPEHEGLVIANVAQYTSCNTWNTEGQLSSTPCFNQFTVNPYFEYGAFSDVTVGLNPFFQRISQSGNVSPFDLVNITPFARFLIQQHHWTTRSVQVGYNQPFTSSTFGGTPTPSSASSASSAYGIENRQRFVDVRFLYGIGGAFDPKERKVWYADFEAAYRPYFDGAADQLHFDIMLGLKVLSKTLVFELQEKNTWSLHNPSNIREPDYNLYSLQPSIIYWFIANLGIQIGLQQDFYGNNVGMGTTPFGAVWWKF